MQYNQLIGRDGLEHQGTLKRSRAQGEGVPGLISDVWHGYSHGKVRKSYVFQLHFKVYYCQRRKSIQN